MDSAHPSPSIPPVSGTLRSTPPSGAGAVAPARFASSSPIGQRKLLWVTLALLVALGTLVLAGAARAAEPVVEASKEAGSPAPVEAPKEPGPPAPVEAPKEPGPPAPVEAPKEPGPPAPVEAPKEPGPPAPIEAPKVAEQPQELMSPGAPIGDHAREAASTEPTGGQAAESSSSSSAAASQNAASSDGASVSPSAEPSGAAIGLLAKGPSEPRGPSAPSGAPRAGAGASAGFAASQRTGELGCELSRLPVPGADSCTAGLLGAQSIRLASLTLATANIRPTASDPAGRGGGNGDDGGSTGWGRSGSPSPGPAPSGAFGGSAAGSGGIGLSGFFTLAGLLLLAAPRALRRLRLSCQPWLTAFFVLIPERPG
jgi:outer membrane biosynthesis protein TonB